MGSGKGSGVSRAQAEVPAPRPWVPSLSDRRKKWALKDKQRLLSCGQLCVSDLGEPMVSSPFHFWAGSTWAHGRLLDLQHLYSALSLGNFSLLGFVGFCETSKREFGGGERVCSYCPQTPRKHSGAKCCLLLYLAGLGFKSLAWFGYFFQKYSLH